MKQKDRDVLGFWREPVFCAIELSHPEMHIPLGRRKNSDEQAAAGNGFDLIKLFFICRYGGLRFWQVA